MKLLPIDKCWYCKHDVQNPDFNEMGECGLTGIKHFPYQYPEIPETCPLENYGKNISGGEYVLNKFQNSMSKCL